MERFLACRPIMRAPQRLAIDRHHSLDGLADSLGPLHKTGFKLFRIDEGKDPAKRVVRGDAIWQIEPCRKKASFAFPNSSISTHPSAPQMTPQIARMLMSRNRWSLVRSIRGSST